MLKKWAVSFLTQHGKSTVYIMANTREAALNDTMSRYKNASSFYAQECAQPNRGE